MIDKWKISIIVPVYKVEKYLNRCVESILSQSYSNWEMILVDDGSPDRCPQMCDEFAAKDMRIKVIHQSNQGLSNARNSGMEIMSGDILVFVDSDDWLVENALEQVADNWSDDIDLCFFDYYDAYEGKTPIRRKCIPENRVNFQQHKLYTVEWLERAINYLCENEPYAKMLGSAWANAYNAKKIKEKQILFPQYTQLIEDRAYMLCCVSAFQNIHYVSLPIYYYFYNKNSLSFMSYSENTDQVLKILDRLCDYVDQIEQKTEYEKRKISSHFYFVVIIILLWRIALDKNKDFKRKARDYCLMRANQIIQNKVTDFPFLDTLIIKLCSKDRFVLLELFIQLKEYVNHIIGVR